MPPCPPVEDEALKATSMHRAMSPGVLRFHRTPLRRNGMTVARRQIPRQWITPERVRSTPLGPWANGLCACGAHRHNAQRQ